MTRVSLQTSKVLAGRVPNTFSINIRGGKIGRDDLRVSHEPVLKMGQFYVLFLKRTNQSFRVYYDDRGAYDLATHANLSDTVSTLLKRIGRKQSNAK
jgi:ribosomal protein S4E